MTVRWHLVSFCAALTIVVGSSAYPIRASTFDEILAPLRHAEGKCKSIHGIHAWSMQARTLYDMDDLWKTFHLEPRAKTLESYECHNHAATVYLYQYADATQAQSALRTIQAFIWGEKQKSSLHPEDIFTVDNVVVVVSGEKPEPVTSVLEGDRSSADTQLDAKVEKEFERAKKAYLKKDYAAAEPRFRSVTVSAPDQLFSWVYLGHSLFYQDKFSEAVPAYERAMALKEKAADLPSTEERILIDQLGMAYGLGGQLDKGKALFEGAIRKDPDYPMYYYNLACTVAEQGDLDAAVTNLKLGFARKSNMLPGETYPDPRTDDSFKQFLGNDKFEAALKEMGF